MQFDPAQYAALKKNGGIRLLKMGGSEGTPDEKVDGVAVIYVRKYDLTTHPPTEIMGDMGPINLAEVLAIKANLQKATDGLNVLLEDMKALKVPTELPPPAPAA